jgi:hypothetical protein
MSGELCSSACGFCGRCDPAWEEPEAEERDDDFDSLAAETDELIKRATNEELYLKALRRWFRQKEAA